MAPKDRAQYLDVGEQAFARRSDLKNHLAWSSFIALARKPGKVLIVDRTLERRAMKSGFFLALSYAFSRQVSKLTSRRRVGIVFPPGIGGFIANMAIVLSGKIPVNLNFTLGPSAIEACIEKADIDCILSTVKVQAKLTEFPWDSVEVHDLVTQLREMPKLRTLILLVAMHLLPSRLLAYLCRVPRWGGEEEAALLFTSGSSGTPKGVLLSHRNVLGNCAQIDASDLLPVQECLLLNLPIFHSFGFTVGLWAPILSGCRVVTTPSPLEVKKAIEAINEESATILLSTPTFLKPYFIKAAPDQLKSLRYVISGAERTPPGFAGKWESTFASLYMQGYGLTEMSPVVAVNLPAKPPGVDYPGSSAEGARAGSVGRPLPGHAVRILNPDTKEPLFVDQVGLLALKGPNVFSGYLDAPEQTEDMMQDGWLVTGDLARLDADGFIYIEGRLSRFSKIAGEMVPHGTVEEAIVCAFGFDDTELPVVAVGGRADVAKGEILVLLTTVAIDLSDLRAKLLEAGLSNLWIPKVIKQVEEIPLLPTGKLDLRRVRELSRSS